MDMNETATMMSELLSMNEASVKLYDEAISKISEQQDIKNTLQQFRGDHQHHVEQLQGWFRQSGQRQMQPSEEFQNFAQTMLQDVRMARGRDEVLKAMTVAEAYDNAAYGQHLQHTQGDAKQMLQQHLDIEHRHWQFIEQYSPLKVMASAGMMGGYGGGMSGGTGGGGMGGGQTGGGMGGGTYRGGGGY